MTARDTEQLQARRWYNRFSHLFDWTGDYPYRAVRHTAIAALELQPGDIVLDLFCGTGVNFEILGACIQPDGEIIAIDISPGMLAQASERLAKADASWVSTTLHARDLKKMTAADFAPLLPPDRRIKVLLTLGAAGLPGWEGFCEALCAALPAGSRLVSMDVVCEPGSWSAAVVNFLGAGDFRLDISTHKPWLALEARAQNFEQRVTRPFKLLNCAVVVSSADVA